MYGNVTHCVPFQSCAFPGLIFENSTGDLRFIYSGLTPYTSYRVDVRAKSVGEVGPETHRDVLTPAEGKNTHTHTGLFLWYLSMVT